MTDQRNVLTIATGKKLYIDLAINLARSFLYRHPDSNINFQLVTDQPLLIPTDVYDKIQVIKIKPGDFGSGFSPKLHLDKLVNEGRTFFIDSDCLIFEKLDTLFDKFKGHDVSVVGGYISDGEWFGDISSICKQFNVPHLPKFNGGLYYLEKGAKATAVYATARELESRYDDFGFVRLRNRPNDEVLMALAMQLHGQTPVMDDATVMSDPQACPGRYKIDVIKGDRLLTNPPSSHPLHQSWYPYHKVSPLIVHFLGSYTLDYPYRMNAFRLEKATQKKTSWITELVGLATIEYPDRLKIAIKNLLRPGYRLIWGFRKVKLSDRL